MLRERIASARPRTVLAFAWLALFLYGFPGQMVPDTFEHLLEARADFYTDASPPVFNVLFGISDATFGGQVLVFLLQITVFVAGAYFAIRRFVPRAHWLTLAFCVFPPVITPLALVWKDSLLPGLLLLGFGLISDPRRRVRMLAMFALFFAIAIRYNAFAATFPIVVLLFEWQPGMRAIKRYATAVGAWLAITFAAFQINSALTDREMHLWNSSLALFDIAGTIKHSTPRITDPEIEKLLAGTGFNAQGSAYERVTKMYRPRNFYFLLEPKDPVWNVRIMGTTPTPKAQRDAIANAWRTVVGDHKGAYLTHRWKVFRECLAMATKLRAYWAVPKRIYEYPATAEQAGIPVHASPVQAAATRVFTWIWKHTPLFEPFVYFVAAFLLLPFALRHRDVLALLLSGIAIEATLFFLASSPDYRYSHWMVLCTILGTIGLVVRRYRPV